MEIWQHLRYLTRKNIVGKHPKNRRRRPYRYYRIGVNEISIPVWPEIEGWSVVDVERATDETIKYTLDL
jgi:predicted transcriptional regulator